MHGTPRLTLFTPDKVQECPVKDSELTGRRRTFVQTTGSTPKRAIEDDFRSDPKPNRGLPERWTGETHFELKSGSEAATEAPVAAPQEAASSSSAPPAPAVVPGTPLPVPAARVPLPAELEEEAVRSAAYDGSSDSSSSSSSSSDEELVPDRPLKRERKRKADAELPRGKVKGNMMAVSCTIDVQEGDLKRLLKKPGKSAIWMSQKMAEKSEEVTWNRLSLTRRSTGFRVEQRPVRGLLQSELQGLDYSRVMKMR